MRVRLLLCATVIAIVAAGCGSSDDATVAAPAEPVAETAAAETGASATGDMPDLEMTNVNTGASVNLQSIVDGETPLLLWFWAPH